MRDSVNVRVSAGVNRSPTLELFRVKIGKSLALVLESVDMLKVEAVPRRLFFQAKSCSFKDSIIIWTSNR